MDAETPAIEMLTADARRAEQAGDWPAALTAWQRVRTCYPDAPAGYLEAAKVHRHLKDLSGAEVELAAGSIQCPQDAAIAEQYAWLAFELQNWPCAHVRWTAVREKFPNSLAGYAVDAAVLKNLGEYEWAEDLYRHIFAQWPDTTDFGLLAEYAELSQAQGDVAETSRRWAKFRAHHPDDPKGYVREALNLESAGQSDAMYQILTEALDRFPRDAGVLIQMAHAVAQRGVLRDTLKRWEAVAKICPSRLDGYLGAAVALYDLGRFTDALNTLQPALRMFPDSMHLADIHARVVYRQDKFQEALKLWADFRQRFPDNAAGYCGGVDALLGLSMFTEADTLIQEGRAMFPRDHHIAVSWCMIPETAQRLEDAEFRWQFAYTRFPDSISIKSGYARILSRLKKWSEAEQILRIAIDSGSRDEDLLYSYAHSATERQDWVNAEHRWRQIMEHFPHLPSGWIGLGDMLRLAGRLKESSQLLAEGLRQFPGDADLEQCLAWTTNFQRDWPAAFRMWADLKRKYPNKANVISGINMALWEAKQDLGVAQSEGRAAAFEVPENLISDFDGQTDDRTALRKMLLKFESLGDSCEFGIVQRNYGAEPIGLLRWATTDPRELTLALETRLAGVGDPENTVIEDNNGEYISWDRRYAMYTHTFTPSSMEPIDTFTGQYLRRLQYLKRKLLEDLKTGKKIFVYKSDDGLSDDQAMALHRATRIYNAKNALLCVRLQDAAHPTATLEQLQDGLFVGYIDRYSTVDINVDVWLDLCQRTLALNDVGIAVAAVS